MPMHPAAWALLAVLAFFALTAAWANLRRTPTLAGRLALAWRVGGFTFYGVTAMDMPLDHRVEIDLVYLDSKKRPADPASLSGLKWEAAGPGTLTTAGDGLSATFLADAAGDVTITVTASNSDGAVLQVSDVIHVQAGVAVELGLTFGEPVPA